MPKKTEKRVKAWAVLDKNGDPEVMHTMSIYLRRDYARTSAKQRGLRIAPVEVILPAPSQGKGKKLTK